MQTGSPPVDQVSYDNLAHLEQDIDQLLPPVGEYAGNDGNPVNVLYEDNFDSYAAGEFPPSWGRVYSGRGWEYCHITDDQSYSAPNSWKLEGQYNWSQTVGRRLPSPPDPNVIYDYCNGLPENEYAETVEWLEAHPQIWFEARVMTGFAPSTPTHQALAEIWFFKVLPRWGRAYGYVQFNYDSLTDNYFIRVGENRIPYEPYRWYHVRGYTDLEERTFAAWVDGELIAVDFPIDSEEWPEMLSLTADNPANYTVVWFDDIKIGYAPPPVDNTPPTSSVEPIEPYWQIQVPFTVTASASDDLSGVANVELYYRHSVDNSTWGPWENYHPHHSRWGWTFDAPEGDGYYEFYSIATDEAGNVEAIPVGAYARCAVVDARRWFPYYKFSKGEPNYPCSFYFDGDNDVTNNPSNYDDFGWIEALFYAYVHPVADETRFTIQYWLYYADQKKWGPFGHPHDWEPMLIVFEENNLSEPSVVGWGRHGKIIYHSYSYAENMDGHPVSYVARDTHADYPRRPFLTWVDGVEFYFWTLFDGWDAGGIELSVDDFNLIEVRELIDERPSRPPGLSLMEQYDWLRHFGVINTFIPQYEDLWSLLDAKPFSLMFSGTLPQPEPAGGWWPGSWPGFDDVPPWYVLDYVWHPIGEPTVRGWVWEETMPDPHRHWAMGFVQSSADLHVYDSQGRHVGINYENGMVERQIPGCKYDIVSGDQFITLEHPSVDNYRVEIVGVENGKYDFGWAYWENGTPVSWEFKENIPITEGEIHVFIFNPWTSPRALKTRSLQKLMEVGADNRMLKRLERSLEGGLWIDDWHIAPTPRGLWGFTREYFAVKCMQVEMKIKKWIPAELKAAYSQVIDNLVEADRLLARTAINEAKEIIVTDPLRQKLVKHLIAKAERKFGKAMEEVYKGRPDRAIIKFARAWQHAQLAIKLAEKPCYL